MLRYFAGAGTAALLAGAPALAQTADASSVEEVIVTGTRVTGLRAVDSPAPIQVVDIRALQASGAADLIASLALTAPSVQAQAIGGDLANETLAMKLRGLSPNHTLVLVNGKRRHGTANLAILSSPFQGGAAADLSLIPQEAIERIEVLTDGAAAQYGSDAIAGVVNIILKSGAEGGEAVGTAGGYYRGDGLTGDLAANAGLSLGGRGFLNLTAETRYHDYANRGGPDQRVERAIASGAHPDWAGLPLYPYLNRIFGDARYQLNLLALNAGYELDDDTHIYGFSTAATKYGVGWANFRLPDKLPQVYPQGFSPIDIVNEHDFAVTGGIAGRRLGWDFDLATTFGDDDGRARVKRSANVDLYMDTGSTPIEFKDGGFEATQWTTTLDLRREIEAGMARPLTLALGAEQRHETYRIDAGDPASRYKAGSQSFPGFALTDAGKHGRDAEALYADIAAYPARALTLDLAGRYEHYSDFGNATVGKLTARYDLSGAFAIRGTASTGFRAPTLAEEFYSATNVQPNSAFVQLPPNAPAARLIGIDPLQPERSTNYSLGFVAHPFGQAVLTADAYQIAVRDRVVGSGTLYGTYGGVLRSAAVNAAIEANGNVLENVPFTGVNVFSNGLDTRTRGLDLVLTFPTPAGRDASIDWTWAANYNRTVVTHVRDTPPPIALSGQSLFDAVAISTLETTYPRWRLTGQALWRRGDWSVRLRGTFYGPTQRWADPGDGKLYLDKAGAKPIFDLEITRDLGGGASLSLGADNLFNTFPDRVNPAGLAASAAAGNPAVEIYPNFSPYGIGGGFWYVRVRKSW